MKSINPYLNFPGTSEQAFNFYKSIFGGEFVGGISRFKDTPDGAKLNDEEKEKVMYIALNIGQNTLMATDALESMGHGLTTGNNFHLTIEADNKQEAETFYYALSKDAKVELPMQDMFWGAYFGMLKDKFGIQWMISYSYPKK
jgi:PhnB protein